MFWSGPGLQTDVSKFFLFYLTLSLTTMAGAAIAFTFSALVNVFAVANLLVSLVFVFYMVSACTVKPPLLIKGNLSAKDTISVP